MGQVMKTTKTTVESLRAERDALILERKTLERSPRGPADVVDAIAAGVDHFASEWAERVDLAIRRVAAGDSAGEAIALLLCPAGGSQPDRVAVVGLAGAAAVRDTLLARVDAVVPAGPRAVERVRRVAEIKRTTEEIELAEEALIVEAELTGLPIPRRADCNPAIVLRYAGDTDTGEPADVDPPTPPEVLEAQQQRALRAAAQRRHEENTAPAESAYMKRRRA
jgi:hypothetical protein